MFDVYELYMIKSKEHETKKTIIDDLTNFCLHSNKLNLVSIFKNDEVLDTKNETPDGVIRLCLFAIYASDIATIPDHQSRNWYLEDLRKIIGEYDLSYQKVIYLSRYANQFFNEIERNQT
jgi:hypothetical protein